MLTPRANKRQTHIVDKLGMKLPNKHLTVFCNKTAIVKAMKAFTRRH